MGISDIYRRDERRKWVRRKAVDLYDQGIRTEDLEGPDMKEYMDLLELNWIDRENLFENLFYYLKQMEERYGV